MSKRSSSSGPGNRSGSAARIEAVRQLQRIDRQGAFVGLVAAGEHDLDLDAREERQATEYVAGVTRWKRWLDFLIAHFYRGQLDQMEPLLRQILRVGVYDLLFLSTPPHAALHEAVALAKRLVRPGAGGLVNGILRSLLRTGDHLPRPQTGDEAADLAIRQSHPTWMVRRWLHRFGLTEAQALLDWNNARPTYGVRANVMKTTPEGFQQLLAARGVAWQPASFLDDFVRMAKLQPLVRAGLLAEAWAAVQDESAGLVVRLLDPQPGEVVIDTCAAPGGKTLYAATRMDNTGQLFAFDVHEARLGLVAAAARTYGLDIVQVAAADLRALATNAGAPQGDRVLLDAPCSGLGVLAKRADLRWRRTPEELRDLVRLQDSLLDAAARLVRPGGLLVYSTCTIEPEENQERVASFLRRYPAFTLEPAHGFVPQETVTPEGFLATLPHIHHVDGAFGARLRHRP